MKVWQRYLDWRASILAKKANKLKRKYEKAIVARDQAEERSTDYWWIRQVNNGNIVLDMATTSVLPATEPIDSMIEVVHEATKVSYQPKTQATSVLDKATTARTQATKPKDNKPLPAKTQGNNEATGNKVGATDFIRNILGNNPEATIEDALQQWQQAGNSETTTKAFRATFNRELKK